MADLGNIGIAVGTLSVPKGVQKSQDYVAGPWVGTSSVVNSLQSLYGPPSKNTSPLQEHVASIDAYVLENGVAVPNAEYTLLKYGPYRGLSWLVGATQLLAAPWIQEVVRHGFTDANGYFGIKGLRKNIDYTLLVHNPDVETDNARAVGMYLPSIGQETVELDFAYQNPAAGRMFFILA